MHASACVYLCAVVKSFAISLFLSPLFCLNLLRIGENLEVTLDTWPSVIAFLWAVASLLVGTNDYCCPLRVKHPKGGLIMGSRVRFSEPGRGVNSLVILGRCALTWPAPNIVPLNSPPSSLLVSLLISWGKAPSRCLRLAHLLHCSKYYCKTHAHLQATCALASILFPALLSFTTALLTLLK